MRLSFREALAGGVSRPDDPLSAAPLHLDLELEVRGLAATLRGAPMAVRGRFEAQGAAARALGPSGEVWGVVRPLLPWGLAYDLRLAAQRDAAPRDVAVLEGARRFTRGDLWASATTFEGTLAARGAVIGPVHLRFDARDDVPALLRSVRLRSRLH